MPPRASTSAPALVIQATFSPGKEPRAEKPAVKPEAAPTKASKGAPAKAAKAAAERGARPPHPATVAQKKAPPEKPARAPHPAKGTAQPKAAEAKAAKRAPHPATVPRGSKSKDVAAVQASFQAPPRLLHLGSLQQGKPLPKTIQAAMEEQLGGADLSAVRVHEGPEAAAIGALALTAGDHLFFAPGQYRPETKSGRALLGKQLAYVIQQREGRVKNPFGEGLSVVRDAALDAEAAARAGLPRR